MLSDPSEETRTTWSRRRLLLVARNGRIEHVFYPVFPPDAHADEVIAWLKSHATA